MTTQTLAAAPSTTRDATTRALLTCVVVANPLWVGVSLIQAATRAGFDLTRHPLSALSTGDLGWLQILNFVVAGVLTVLGAVGLRRALPGKWVPRLVLLNGIGMVAAGVFVMSPANGFPLGAPTGMVELTWPDYGHFAAGTIAFVSLIAACYVLARSFARAGRRRHAVLSLVAGTALLVGDLWAMSGGAGGSITLAVGVFAAMAWISTVAAELR
ncbi:DUF998 domain-containing protein [Actinokineospora globicatena]|uniref:DUF998 domain-containing protein n=1 Tax=Actinokineospora globicatena TaxID=103729 RepID=UPI0020A25D0C|nr:DUF998 domain-containing protein [Actinokineospora globicatena]MCP2306460.1 Protein of unknown function (DUF998) [Actinokineospora globicatena]GLW81887.1 hypothetical protein Aglo01_63680 [Actinokineospora globicatena]GLW88681.1 hypothetical protein Aglo02_63200 [Actinokineospora globicatena]